MALELADTEKYEIKEIIGNLTNLSHMLYNS